MLELVFIVLWGIGMGGFCFFLLWCFNIVEFGNRGSVNQLPPMTLKVPMTEVKPPKPEAVITKPNISEPVISFVQCVKDNPRRFKTNLKIEKGTFWHEYKSTILDRMTGKEFYLIRYSMWEACNTLDPVSNPEWLTQEEIKYVEDELRSFFHFYNNQRKERLHAIQRARMARDYVK